MPGFTGRSWLSWDSNPERELFAGRSLVQEESRDSEFQ